MASSKVNIRHLILLALVCHVSRAQNSTTLPSTASPVSLNVTTTSPATTTTTSTTTATASTPPANKDNNKCLNGGTVGATGQCQCATGYFGDVCQYVPCGKENQEVVGQCQNEGVCWEHYQTKEPFCKCKPTFKGELCESPICQDYCLNYGTCDDGLGDQYDFDVNSYTIVATPTCKCRSRYRGARCQFDNCYSKVDPAKQNCYMNGTTCEYSCGADCDKAFCNGRGRCALVSDSTHRLICQCQFGFSGTTCNINACNGYCFNNGTCSAQNNTISCQCTKEFSGHRCSKPVKVDDNNGGKGGSKLKSFIYGLTLTMTVCLVAVGAYYLVQKGYFRQFNPMGLFNKSRGSSDHSSSSSSPSSSGGGVRSFFRANLGFNKLEDEQIITQNEEGIDNL